MANLYESSRLLDEYLLFHYAEPADVLPWPDGPHSALGFPVRTVSELLPAGATGRALDVGCAVGRSSLELSRTCQDVTGIDYSHSFVRAAEAMRSTGEVTVHSLVEAGKSVPVTLHRPTGVHPERVRFEQGDAMDLRADLGAFDIVHAANLLCRLTEPARFLTRLPALVNPGGWLLLTTPCTWLEEFTPPARWPDGDTMAWLEDSLRPDFTLATRRDLPFLIREHARKFQWSVALASVWQRKTL